MNCLVNPLNPKSMLKKSSKNQALGDETLNTIDKKNEN